MEVMQEHLRTKASRPAVLANTRVSGATKAQLLTLRRALVRGGGGRGSPGVLRGVYAFLWCVLGWEKEEAFQKRLKRHQVAGVRRRRRPTPPPR